MTNFPHQNNISVLYTNADSLTNKKTELLLLLKSLNHKPSIIAITEVKPKISSYKLHVSEISVDGYNVFYSGLDNENSRGTVIYVDNCLSASQISLPVSCEENVFVELKGVNKLDSIVVGNMYRSPHSSSENNCKMYDTINYVCDTYKCKKIIVGDFNFGNINWNSWQGNPTETKFLNCLRKIFLLQHIAEPTRYRGSNTPSLLDLIITDKDFISNINYLSPLGKSDHSVLSFDCTLKLENVDSSHKLNYSKGNYVGFRSFIDRNWVEELGAISNDVEEIWQYLKAEIEAGIKQFIPLCKGNSWKKKETWSKPVNAQHKALINKKHRLWKKFIETRDIKVMREYKIIRNKVRKESRKLEKQHQVEIAKSCKNNSKCFWRYVRDKTGVRNGIPNLKVNRNGTETTLCEDVEKANALVDHFSTVFTVEPDDDFTPLDTFSVTTNMTDLNIDEAVVYKKLSELKLDKSPGPDNLHPRILFELRSEICKPLQMLFELSLKTGKTPSDWRSAVITALHKKGSKADVSNYRPVSLTCVICKVMESIVRDHITKYLIQNKLFSDKQYGFIKGRSSTLQLLNMLDSWTNCLEDGGQIDVIYTDFEKAFDKVPHKRLLSKLQSYGIAAELIKWIEGFLLFRRQQVRVNSGYSYFTSVLSGIPQGSILGPLLFVIYINDLPSPIMDLVNCYLFADDAKLCKHVQILSDSEELQKAFYMLRLWSEQWLLKLNFTKCSILSVSRRDPTLYDYYIKQDCDFKLQRCDSTKDLGVIIDSKLTFEEHITEKVNKAYSILGIIKRNFEHIDRDAFILLYKSMVRSHLEFSNSVWSPYRVGLTERIEKVQKRATKLVPACKGLTYTERLRVLGIPTLKYRRCRGDMIETYKILHAVYDNAVSPVLTLSHDSITRGNTWKLVKNFSRYDMRKYVFTQRIINIWNSLPVHVANSSSINSFKNNLDRFWSNQEVYYNFRCDITGTGNRSLS